VDRLLVALIVLVVASCVALVARWRRQIDAPTQLVHRAPSQLDRSDFERPEAPWLVAVFTSATCHTCADVARKAAVLEAPAVAVTELEHAANRELHERYGITAVPTLVVADAEGVVRASFLGPVSATDLWAAVAEVRDDPRPDSTPESLDD